MTYSFTGGHQRNRVSVELQGAVAPEVLPQVIEELQRISEALNTGAPIDRRDYRGNPIARPGPVI